MPDAEDASPSNPGHATVACGHLDWIHDVQPNSTRCEACVELGDSWVQLRLCLTCGHVGCCDSSKNRHASRHFKETGHPVVQSYLTRLRWRWCYIDWVAV